MKNKIIFIIPDLRCGGAEKVFINLANHLSDEREIIFILLKKRGEMIDQLKNNIKIISLDVNRIRNSFFKLIKYFRKYNNAYIISAMWPLNCIVLLSSLFGSKSNLFFITEHVNLTRSNGVDFKINKIFLFLTISLTYFIARKIICVSNGVNIDIQKYYLFNGKKKFKTIYNPIVSKVEKIKKINNSKIHILNVGTLKAQKDHKTLIKAFSLLDNIDRYHLNIVGDGPLKNELIQFAEDLMLKDHITFHGFQKNLKNFYLNSDLFILSSIYEGFGNVLVEAMSYGMQIISTDCPSGPSEILDNGKFGILVPISDTKAITSAIKKIIYNKFDDKLLIDRSKDFEITNISKQYIDTMNL